VRTFLSPLANEGRVSVSTRNQATTALTFLYRDVLREPFGWIDGIERGTGKRRIQW